MPITLGANIASLTAQRKLGQTTDALSRIRERLASGQRINHASDDAAGLSVASQLNVNARLFGQAYRNINDGVSALSISEGATQALSDIVVRITELAEQAANGTYSDAQRTPLNSEAQALRSEFNRILSTTQFNGVKLLDGSSGGMSLQVSTDSSANSRLSVGQGYAVSRMTGDGTLSDGVQYSFSHNASTFDTADLNGDGIVDLVVSGGGGTASYSVSLGNGDGSFRVATDYSTNNLRALALGDMNKDGRVDMMGDISNFQEVRYYQGLGTGAFASPDTLLVHASWGDQSYVADMNNDGNLDYIVADADSTGDAFRVFLGNGNGTFKAALSTRVTHFVAGVTLGDFDRDGIQDVVLMSDETGGPSDSLQYYRGLGDGTFAARATITNLAPDTNWDVNAGDVNGDGKLDLITTGNSGAGTQWVKVSLGIGDGTFAAQATAVVSSFNLTDSTTADLNGDGLMDIIAAGGGTLLTALSNGDGTFKASITRASGASVNNANDTLIISDFNGDGVKDVAMSTGSGTSVSIFLGSGIRSYDLESFSLATRAGALSALDTMNGVMASINSSLGKLGADQGRLASALNVVQTARIVSLAAASSISDANIASDSAEMVRLQIQQQSQAAILAHANQQPALALQLLK